MTNTPSNAEIEKLAAEHLKALGNSWAVPNVRWIGQRIDAAVRRLR